MITDQDAILREVLDEVKIAVEDDTSDVFIAAQPLFFPAMGQSVVQVIPGVVNAQQETAGHGLVSERFQVVLWHRLFTDLGGQSTELITNETMGALAICRKIRNVLIQSLLDGLATIPVRYIQTSQAADPPIGTAAGWVMFSLTFEVGYEIAWEPIGGPPDEGGGDP
jgi:hypothetical protein